MMIEEMMQKAKAVQTATALKEAAGEAGVELTEEQAKFYFDRLHGKGEVADEELTNVAGGGCGKGGSGGGSENPIFPMFPENAHVMRRGFQRCCESNFFGSCMSEYWIVQEQNEDSGTAKWFCPQCGRCETDFIGGLVEV